MNFVLTRIEAAPWEGCIPWRGENPFAHMAGACAQWLAVIYALPASDRMWAFLTPKMIPRPFAGGSFLIGRGRQAVYSAAVTGAGTAAWLSPSKVTFKV